jgi:hypothetical protein
MATLAPELEEVLGQPAWIESWLQVTPGRDPLGLQTITQDRIMPRLVPGVLVLTQRARYLSFYAFLLAEYERRQLPAANNALSTFVKAREFELAAALQLCPNGCGRQWSGVVGYRAVRAAMAANEDPIPRGESVQSYLGGYGLYYRSPLIDLGVVAPRGTALGDETTPVDVLRRGDWVEAFSGAYGAAVSGTAYYADHFMGTGPIPLPVLRAYAEVGCLCRLDDFPDEQRLLRELLFSPRTEADEAPVRQRQRSFALALRLVEVAPQAVRSDDGYRDAIVSRAAEVMSDETAEGEIFAGWAALVTKEYMQEALSCMWLELCTTGLALQGADGMSVPEVTALLRTTLLPPGPLTIEETREVHFRPDTATSELWTQVAEATEGMSLEALRAWAVGRGTAVAGLVLLLATMARLPDVTTVADGWALVAQQRSEYQPGLLLLRRLLDERIGSEESVADTFEWLGRRYLIEAHERIAYSKMPEFTFRFRWEDGRLRFYDNGAERFILANMHRVSITQIARDVGLWQVVDDKPTLTPLGRSFLQEAFE